MRFRAIPPELLGQGKGSSRPGCTTRYLLPRAVLIGKGNGLFSPALARGCQFAALLNVSLHTEDNKRPFLLEARENPTTTLTSGPGSGGKERVQLSAASFLQHTEAARRPPATARGAQPASKPSTPRPAGPGSAPGDTAKAARVGARGTPSPPRSSPAGTEPRVGSGSATCDHGGAAAPASGGGGSSSSRQGRQG
ncbi:CCR4-NOT transcription complex subunit 3-like [Pezoporus flaviventris]|uniref:CCR4-NOT transcription complex subunit 3-like n=1 Tax=Pezoporus flaviventris TaxID=889875 RepID=UPI002AB21A36|nr:CCR4-NOT transcription complex subunit 3-like [Pezoporus flaviventris]